MRRILRSIKAFFGFTESNTIARHTTLPFNFPKGYPINKQLKIITVEGNKKFKKKLTELKLKTIKKKQYVATHLGNFHTDEVMATILLKYGKLIPNNLVVRSRDKKILKNAKVVYDVGNEFNPEMYRFDHHMYDFAETLSPVYNIKLSSCGLIYKYHGKEAIRGILATWGIQDEAHINKVYYSVYENLIMSVDAIDNGISQYGSGVSPLYRKNTDLHSRVGRLNRIFDKKKSEEGFTAALDTCEEAFLWQVYESSLFYNKIPDKKLEPEKVLINKSTDEVKEPIKTKNESNRRIKELVYNIKGEENGDRKIVYIIKLSKNFYLMHSVLRNEDKKENKLPLSKKLRGLKGKALNAIIPNAIFVSKDGLFSAGKTYNSVVKMVEINIEEINSSINSINSLMIP